MTLHRLWINCLFAVLVFTTCSEMGLAATPDDFPRFIVPGKEQEMESLRSLFWLHYQSAGPALAVWDEWLANSTLWPARGEGTELSAMRTRWRNALVGRAMNTEGYVLTQQHDGLGHAEGWPFPLWTQAGGIGWHFRGTGVQGYDAPAASPKGWQLNNATGEDVNDKGWDIQLVGPEATAQTPAFAVPAMRGPWLRLNWWASGLKGADCYVEWTTQEQPHFSQKRRVNFRAVTNDPAEAGGEARTMIPVFRHSNWKGVITGLRIGFNNVGQGRVIIKSFHTASDTRHNVNNLNFIRACRDYFLWTGDVDFLREQIGRIRAAMLFVEHEFQTRKKLCIYTTWPGHEGQSGVQWVDGKKVVLPGVGVGSNYWDLLPFGGEDALATIYYYDTLLSLAALEKDITEHPDWHISSQDAYHSSDLRRHAADVKRHFDERFWNPVTGRFGTIDLDGALHDYGFTFLNNEAIHFDISTPEQARSICDWLAGARTVAGDTSTGTDIYHWRFGPRSTTRRNIDYYFWGWSNPEQVPWGNQVQDGGAVLAWSYYDLMARLKMAGPDEAASRLAEINRWFNDTQAEGGYRAYYGKDPSRGTLQGGNVPGGLGLDHEFIESVMLPQVMLYGFLGFRPTTDGFAIAPKLPKDWSELTITRIHLRDHILTIKATRDGEVTITDVGKTGEEIVVHAPPEVKSASGQGVKVRLLTSSP